MAIQSSDLRQKIRAATPKETSVETVMSAKVDAA
jgi:hypothetical protein